MSPLVSTRSADRLRRFIAAASAALVLALTIFSASPTAHAWLHADASDCSGHTIPHDSDHSAKDAGCAVVLFASGVSLPVGPADLTPPALPPQGVSPVAAAEFHLVSPRYLRQPERGPPLSWVS